MNRPSLVRALSLSTLACKEAPKEAAPAPAPAPVLNPVEMAMPDAKGVEKVLTSTPQYVEAFAKAFPGEKEPVTFENAA
ncbi:MAG: hypothetical protein FJ086_02385 [Deltaproteobacteria bacterium]|nr:hypothetical protein [Deltaproteobacteria bacterium]